MSGGKGGSTTQTASIPAWVESASQANLAKANEIAALGPMRNYGPTVAAFNDSQTAGFQNTADLASAFGMNAPADVMAGMPEAQDFGGVMGYSAAPVVDQQLATLKQNAPDQAAAFNDLFMDPGGRGLFPAIEAKQKRIG
jgi:hypothetical protein